MSSFNVYPFGTGDPLDSLPAINQVKYLRCYLADLGARTIIEEPEYLDRDWLAEYSSYYSACPAAYRNSCRRLFFFSDALTPISLDDAAGGSAATIRLMQDSFLGFCVIRPLEFAPMGRTVLAWYPDQSPTTPRVIEPARNYVCHIAGIELSVKGIAWQQQDTNVGACATVALWSMLHSSAFDDHYAIPTTADITRLANRKLSFGARLFPSGGLQPFQVLEAIKECGLAPVASEGEIRQIAVPRPRFSQERFSALCASLIRSGYPALIAGDMDGAGHAICAVGFREPTPASPNADAIELHDGAITHLYVHDDNIGPNVRFEIVTENGAAALRRSPPTPRHAPSHPDPTAKYPVFVPYLLVGAVHEHMRISPDALHEQGADVAKSLITLMNAALDVVGQSHIGLTISTRFVRTTNYIGAELGRTLTGAVLGRARLKICEKLGPLPLHVGMVRIGVGSSLLMDVLFETTVGDRRIAPLCVVAYQQLAENALNALRQVGQLTYGPIIQAY